MPWRENKGVCQFRRMLDGIYTDVFGVAWRLEIFGGNLFKEVAYARNNLKFREAANKIFKKISTENALEFLASGEGFILDRIGDARNLNKNLENNL